ncbi:hypothetical protein ALQ64_102712 [Pseudomonas cannabina]|uniref:Uncharacterized protein n=1 Tax=Pseudomonas cannabina TaxID=86840 RepID=A0A0P9LQ03_PSECA|nr:hypothetical protein ALO83_104026 [Pseudomonas cannabina pv. alisalensis]KPW77217.1 hypothetical protein ALO81_102418 [Pseudomonas cannabina]RMN36785.1 hypothetical protein ALQ64_102712 [Pseudomonas cannabina]RMN89905.1 hypothetical protein ALQ52_104756 [Pseudomonas cannabina pv. alisalensis]RMN98241.1 hypothetical protein ALQ51_102347 [Pseudomonas cannabina]
MGSAGSAIEKLKGLSVRCTGNNLQQVRFKQVYSDTQR